MQTALECDAVPEVSVDHLVARSGDLKSELVAFAQCPPFERRLTARLADAADRDGHLDELTAIGVVDRFVLQYRPPGGPSVLERFVARRRPPLPVAEREMVIGWHEVIEAIFEVRAIDDDVIAVHNLLDDLVYRVRSNMGAAVFTTLREGMFIAGRIVPIHPAVDEWLLSGHFSAYPGSAARHLAQAALQVVTASPAVLRRNPDKLRRSWEIQARHRESFIEYFGSDLVVLPPATAQRKLTEYYRLLQSQAGGTDEAAERAATIGCPVEDLAYMPEELLATETVALVYDEVEGLNYYADFGRLDELFAEPALVKDRSRLTQLRSYLRDDSVSPLAIRRLVQRHPDGADPVFRRLLGKPGFVWERDGETLLRGRKKDYVDREPLPSVSAIGDRLTELLRATR